MDFIRGVSRDQGTLFPERLDDYITDENPVRFLDAFVDELDLEALGFARTTPAWTGRSPYDPKDLLKLYIYGYLNQTRSSRKLEAATYKNVEVMWLIHKLHPDHKTIADFRKDNAQAFKNVFRTFAILCRDMDLFGGQLIAVDGSKFKAVNSPDRHFTKDQLEAKLRYLDEKIDTYLALMDETDADEQAADCQDQTKLEEKIKQMKTRQKTYTKVLSDLEESGEKQISLTDPDSRSMPKSPGAKVGYNVQTATDEHHHLIVEQEVTNDANDKALLSTISKDAKATMTVETLAVVADRGYYNGEELKDCEEEDILPYVPKPDTSSSKSKGLYGKDAFVYDQDNNCYICPAGEILTYQCTAAKYPKRETRKHFQHHYTTKACLTCPQKSKCTTNKKGRFIYRWVDEHILERAEDRLKDHPEMMKKRSKIVEHPFGTIKFWNDQHHFLVKGLERVKGEFSLMTLAYNIKRVITIKGVSRMIQALA